MWSAQDTGILFSNLYFHLQNKYVMKRDVFSELRGWLSLYSSPGLGLQQLQKKTQIRARARLCSFIVEKAETIFFFLKNMPFKVIVGILF